MALKQAGVELKLKNLNTFINGLRSAQNAYVSYGKSTSNISKAINTISNSIRKVPVLNLNKILDTAKTVMSIKATKDSLKSLVDMYNQMDKRTREAKQMKPLISALEEVNNELKSLEVSKLEELKNYTTKDIPSMSQGLHQFADGISDVVNEMNTVSNAISSLESMFGGSGFADIGQGIGELIGLLFPGEFGETAVLGGIGWAVGKAVDMVIAGVSKIGGAVTSILGKVGDVVGGVFNIIGGVVEAATAPLRYFLGGLWRIAEYAMGGLLYRGVVETFNAITGAITDSIEAISTFQLLRIRLQRVKGIEIFETGQVETLKEGLAAAVKPAENLLYAMKKIAITTMFTTQDVANTFAFAKTMGITDQQALRLTNTINDFVSGMGLWPDTAQRIIINLEQMARAGKVTGTELRDLARGAMIPLMDIFKNMQGAVEMGGMSLDEFRKKVSAGEVSVDQFFKSFIEVVERDFAGAAEAASNTMEGLKNNLLDLIQSGFGDELFGPLAQKIVTGLNGIIKGLLNEETFSALKSVGSAIVGSFDLVFNTIQNKVVPVIQAFLLYLGLIPPEAERVKDVWVRTIGGVDDGVMVLKKRTSELVNFVKPIAQFVVTVGVFISNGIKAVGDFLRKIYVIMVRDFTKINDRAKSWGQGLGEAFAAGLRLAAKAIIGAIKFIAGIMKWFMSPGSPPRMYPDLDKDAEAVGEIYASSFGDGTTSTLQKKISDIKLEIMTFTRELRVWIRKVIPDKLPFNIFGGEAFTGSITGSWKQEAINTFDDVASTVQSFYQSLVNVTIGENDVTEMILRMRNVIRDAITGIMVNGQDLQQTLSQAFSSMGHISPEAQEYIRLSIQMAQANKAVADAQEEINRITEHYDAILRPLEQRLADIRGAATDLDDKREISRLMLVLKDPNATADEKERARLRIEELKIEKQIRDIEKQKTADLLNPQEQLRIAEANRDALAKQVEYYKSIVEMQIENNNLLQRQWELIDKLTEERQDEIDRLNKSISDAQERLSESTNELTSATEELSNELAEGLNFGGTDIPEWDIKNWFNFDEMLADAEKTWGDFSTWWNTEITGKLQPEITSLGESLSTIYNIIMGEDKAGGDLGPKEKPRIVKIIDDVKQAIAAIVKTWNESGAQITIDIILDRTSKLFGGTGTDPNDTFLKNIQKVIQDIIIWFGSESTMEGINSFFDTMEKIRGFLFPDFTSKDPNILWGSVLRGINDAFKNGFVEIGKTIMSFTSLDGLLKRMGEVSKEYLDKSGKVSKVWDSGCLEWEKRLKELADKLVYRSIIPDMMDEIYRVVSGRFDDIWRSVSAPQSLFDNLWGIGVGIIDNIIRGIGDARERLADTVRGIAQYIPQWLRDWLGMNSPSKMLMKIGFDAGNSVAMGMLESASNMMSAANILSSTMAGGYANAGLMYSPALANSGSSYTNNYNLSINSGLPPNVVAGSFAAMKVKAGK